jgi:hypothetical protein
MASSIPPILVQLQADVSQLKAGMAQAETSLKGVDDKVKTTGAGMSKFSGQLKTLATSIGVAFSAAAVLNFAKQSVMASSNMEESLTKVAVVFGEGAAEVEKFGRNAAENLGISNQKALEATGTYGNLFQAFGLGQGESQKMSTSLVQLASDMASFNNTSVDDAILALRSGLSGETEPLKRFGVALSEVRLKEEAMRMGLIKTMSGTLPVAAKSQAAYALIMRDTALAQGDYARTADGTANTMKTLQARFEDAKVAVGDALIPAFRGLLGILNLLIPVLTAIGNFFKNNQDEVKAFAITIGVITAAYGTYLLVTNAATIATKALSIAMKANPIGLVVVAVGLLVAGMVKLFKSNETFRNIVISVAKVAIKAFASIIPMLGQVFEAVMKVVTGPLRAFLEILSKLPKVGKYAKAGLDFINKGLDGISDFADSAAKKATGLIASLDNVGKQADKTATKVKAATVGVKETTTGKAKGSAVSTKDLDAIKKAQTAFDEDLLKAREKYAEDIADADKNYAKAQVEIRKDNAKELIDIAKDYAAKVKDIEANLQEKLTSLRADADKKRADLTKQAADKQISIIQQSIDRLRSAFATGAAFSISDLFKGKTSGGFLESMKKQLADAKALQEGAAFLAGQGYAQTFIEEVVKAGPTAGLDMINELKKATPEQQKVIQETFMDLESIQDTGLDSLAKSMNNGANLATSQLRDAYDQVAIDLKNSLAEVDAELKTSMAEANADYLKAMTQAATVRDERIADSLAKMEEALAAAKAKYDEALADASATLQKSLNEAMKAFEKSIEATSVSTTQKINLLKTQLKEVAALMASLQTARANAAAAAAPSPSNSLSDIGFQNAAARANISNPTTNNNIAITGVNMADPKKIASDVVNGIKYGSAVTVNTPNKTFSQSAAVWDR